MTPIDVSPPAVVTETDTPDAATDEMEWLAIESAAFCLWGETSYRMPQPDGFRYPKTPYRPGSAYWLGPKSSGPRIHPKGYRLKGESAGMPRRAGNQYEVADFFAGTTATYAPPPLGPWQLSDTRAKGLGYTAGGLRYLEYKGEWR